MSNRRKSHLSDPQLTRLKDLICASTGLWFSPERWLELDYGFKAAALQLGFEDPDSCARWLLSKAPLSRRETEILATHLAVGETYFFREKRTFNALQKTVLPAVIGANRARGARRLRIWSAGCATGEEVYSIAILLKQTIPDLCDWKITLMGTDINPVFLKSAVKGIYGEWSFRDAPAGMKESYFRALKNGRYEIDPTIRAMVDFSPLNLAFDILPSLSAGINGLDFIFCRNVLMYFDKATARRVTQGFFDCLAEGGFLVVSGVECSAVLFPQFQPLNLGDVVFYQKVDSGAGRQDACVPSAGKTGALPVDEKRLPDSWAPAPVSQPAEQPWSTALLPAPTEAPSDNRRAVEHSSEAPARSATAELVSELYRSGHYEQTVQKAAELLEAEPLNREVWAVGARACANQGKLEEGLHWCEHALACDPFDCRLQYLRGLILQEMGETDKAAAAMKRVLYLDGTFVLAEFSLGHLRLQQSRRKEASRHFRNALSLLSGLESGRVIDDSEGTVAGRLAEVTKAIMISYGL